MSSREEGGGHVFSADLPLGRQVEAVAAYSPGLLCPIPRAETRVELPPGGGLTFSGADVWNAYELSWLNARGMPRVGVGRFTVPCESPCLIESKSLKLYLNSLNQTRFDSLEALQATVQRDLSASAGAAVEVEFWPPGQVPGLEIAEDRGDCLDVLDIAVDRYHPDSRLLTLAGSGVVSRRLYTDLFRSLCPVTGQPDWASVALSYRGPAIEEQNLLRYLISYREHQGFHEQCVERIFLDIARCCGPESLTVQAFFLRRGGLDINPFRSNAGAAPHRGRWLRQ